MQSSITSLSACNGAYFTGYNKLIGYNVSGVIAELGLSVGRYNMAATNTTPRSSVQRREYMFFAGGDADGRVYSNIDQFTCDGYDIVASVSD
jgi:hypothetical protein